MPKDELFELLRSTEIETENGRMTIKSALKVLRAIEQKGLLIRRRRRIATLEQPQ